MDDPKLVVTAPQISDHYSMSSSWTRRCEAGNTQTPDSTPLAQRLPVPHASFSEGALEGDATEAPLRQIRGCRTISSFGIAKLRCIRMDGVSRRRSISAPPAEPKPVTSAGDLPGSPYCNTVQQRGPRPSYHHMIQMDFDVCPRDLQTENPCNSRSFKLAELVKAEHFEMYPMSNALYFRLSWHAINGRRLSGKLTEWRVHWRIITWLQVAYFQTRPRSTVFTTYVHGKLPGVYRERS